MTDVDDVYDLDDWRPPQREPALRRRPSRHAATSAAVAVVLVGSVGGAIAFTVTASSTGSPLQVSALAGSAAAMKQLSSYRFAVSASGLEGEVGGLARVAGSVDNVHGDSDVSTSLGAHSFEERTVGKVVYFRTPDSGQPAARPWTSIAVDAALAVDSFSTADDLIQELGVLKKLADVQTVGLVTLDGVTTTEFRGTLSAAELADDGSDDTGSDDSAAEATGPTASPGPGARPVNLDVYADAQGRIRRLVITDTVIDGGLAQHMLETVDFSSFDEPVTVVAPPADQVQAAPLDGSTDDGAGGPGAELSASPVPSD